MTTDKGLGVVRDSDRDRCSVNAFEPPYTGLAPYIVLSTQRTGSHLLGDVLKSHPAFAHSGETLLPGTRKRGSFDAFMDRMDRCPSVKTVWYRYLQYLRQDKPNAEHVGFLVKYGHVRRIGGLDLVSDPLFARVRIIHLVRRNALRTAVSHQLAVAREVHVTRVPMEHKVNSLSVHPDRLLKMVRQKLAAAQVFRRQLASRERCIELAYEDLMEGDEVRGEIVTRLCDFFDVRDAFSRIPGTIKLAPQPLEHLLENYSEVATIFREADLGYMLEDEV